MKRRLYHVASALSLVACVLTVVLSIESYRNPGTMERNHLLGWTPVSQDGRAGGFSRIRHIWVMLARGRVEIHYGELWRSGLSPPDAAEVAWWNNRYIDPPQYRRGQGWTRLGFEWQWDPLREAISAYGGAEPRIRRAGAPLWALTILTSTLPIAWLAAMWRRKCLMVQGGCATCGYDLRASKDRCPECGTPF